MLCLAPSTIRAAKQYVKDVHRHHHPPQGALFAVACERDGVRCGVAIIGRPVARMLQDGFTAEVTRLATDGTPNACSLLYGAAWRAAKALGYRRLVTYILASEHGTSLRAAGWQRVETEPETRGWSRPKRKRKDKHPLGRKIRWQMVTNTPG